MKKSNLMDTYMPLKGGEKVIASLEGDAYNVFPNIIFRILGFITRIIAILTGSPRKMYIIVTDTRVITIETTKALWFIDRTIRARSYLPRSITRVGYVLDRDWLVFKSHYLEFAASGLSMPMLVRSKEGKSKVYELIYKISFLAERVATKKK